MMKWWGQKWVKMGEKKCAISLFCVFCAHLSIDERLQMNNLTQIDTSWRNWRKSIRFVS